MGFFYAYVQLARKKNNQRVQMFSKIRQRDQLLKRFRIPGLGCLLGVSGALFTKLTYAFKVSLKKKLL